MRASITVHTVHRAFAVRIVQARDQKKDTQQQREAYQRSM